MGSTVWISCPLSFSQTLKETQDNPKLFTSYAVHSEGMKGREMGSFLEATYHVNDPGELIKQGIIESSGASSNVGFFAPGSKIQEPTQTYKILKKDRVSLEKLISHLLHEDHAAIQSEIDQMK